jgi:hypothetical protein
MGRLRLRIGFIIFLILCIAGIQVILNHSEAAMGFYIHKIFLPLQCGRSLLLNKIDISIGDILYLLLALLLLLLFIRLVYFLITYRKNKPDFQVELLRFITFPLLIYFFFLVLWGGNYSRKPLAAKWDINYSDWNTARLTQLNVFLIKKMNTLKQDSISYPGLKVLNASSNFYYHQQFGKNLPPLKVKATALGYLLNYIGVHGYYNPLSGESQFNRFIPAFMHPFVLTHEMAHQAGIAREDDANLLAYIIGVRSGIPAYRYSAYFNLFLYAYSDLEVRDSVLAKQLLLSLNTSSRSDMKTLEAMYKKYRSTFRGFSNSLYDEYLRLHGQSKGLESYNYVVHWVYYWELKSHEQARVSLLSP